MYQIMESIANRLIIFLLKRARGEYRGEKLIHVIRLSIIIIAVLLFVNVLLVTNNIYYRIYTGDLEKSVAKVSFLFREENNPLSEFVNVNKDLQTKLDQSRRFNMRLIKDNTILTNKVMSLLDDLDELKKSCNKK